MSYNFPPLPSSAFTSARFFQQIESPFVDILSLQGMPGVRNAIGTLFVPFVLLNELIMVTMYRWAWIYFRALMNTSKGLALYYVTLKHQICIIGMQKSYPVRSND